MAGTIQKKIKWSKGQIVPELVERADMAMFDSSAQKMDNVVSTVFGGVRSRYGTKYIDVITALNEEQPDSITSDIFNDTSHFTDNTYCTANTVGANRTLALLDFGESEEGYANLTVKNISVLPYTVELSSTGTTTQTIPHGLYEVTVVGAGGGGAGASDAARDFKACEAGGGSGSYVKALIRLDDGNYSATVGAGGNGAGGLYGTFTGSTGGDSSFASYITAYGGTGGIARWTDGTGGNPTGGTGGALPSVTGEESISERLLGSNGGTHQQAGTAVGGSNPTEYGKGGDAFCSGGTAVGYKGGDGYIKYQMMDTDMNLKISGSIDGTNWVEIANETVTTGVRDIEVELQYKYRYIKMEIVTEEVSLPSGIRFQYIREDISAQGDTTSAKLVPFVYNNSDKYLFVLTDETIQIFKNDSLLTVVTATGLKREYFDDLKYTQKDDTVVFTHADMYPKILKRTGNDTFTFGDLDLQNIPYTLFGDETTTTKSVGITPSEMEGAIKITADSSVFDSSWVGQYIDGNGGRVKITEYVSGTVVNGITIIPFYTKDKITSWSYISGYEEVWSAVRGYPRTCLFAQQRLWFGGSKGKPSTVWASRLGDYYNFKNSGNYDNDSIDVDLLTNDVIVNMVDNRGLHIFTTGEEVTAAEGTYTPDKISFTTNTRNGSISRVNPIILSGNVCYIEKNGKSLLNYVYDDAQAAYVSDNVSMLSNLVNHPVAMDAEINSSKDRGDFLYMVLDDGTMVVGCLVLSQDIKSLSRFKTSGDIKDVACLIDETYLIVERNGRTCLEKLVQGNICDSMERRYVTSDTISGLYRQKGSVVYVWSDKRVYGRFDLNSYEIVLPSVPNEYCNIGIAYEYEVEGNPISINYKTTSIKKRIATADALCKETEYLTFCGQKKKGKDQYKFYACTKYDNDVRYNIKGEFYPMQILSLQLNINYEE